MPSLAEVKQYLGGQISGKPFLPSIDLSGKTYVITGSNTGLGLDCAKHLYVFPNSIKCQRKILTCMIEQI